MSSHAVPWRSMIVGTGAIAAAHAVAYERMRDTPWSLVAAVDIDAGRAREFATQHGIPRIHTDLSEALASERPDLLHICTPPSFHARQAIEAMEAGAHVLCEKPLCGSLNDFDLIEETKRRTGRHCAVVFQWRYGSGMRHLKQTIDRGTLGRPLVVVCNTLWYRSPDYYAVPWRGRWETEFGGPTMGHGIHLMDSLLWLMGEWTSVLAVAETVDRPIEVEDVSAAIVRFDNGAIATVVNSVVSPRQESYLRVDFQRATVEATGLYEITDRDWKWTAPRRTIDLGAAGIMASASDTEEQPDEGWGAIPDGPAASHGTVVREVCADLAAGRTPPTSGPEARRTIEFLTAIYLSAHTRRPVAAAEIASDHPFYYSVSGRATPPVPAGG